MGKKELYEFLEKTDEGKALVPMAKKIFEDYDNEAGGNRVKIGVYETALKSAGVDDLSDTAKISDILKGKISAAAGSADNAAKSEIELLSLQVKGLVTQLESEKGEKAKALNDKRRSDLSASFGSDLKKAFGDTVGELLTKKYIDDESITIDPAGAHVFKTSDAVYTQAQALEYLKVKHKDAIVVQGHAGQGGAPLGKQNPSTMDIGKSSAVDLISAGLS